MPEEEPRYNQPPVGPDASENKSYPQEPKKDDGFLSSPPAPPHTEDKPKPDIFHKETPHREAFDQFNQGKSSSAPNVIVWIAFTLVILATGFFWMSDYSNVKAISEKESEKNSIVSQLNSTDNKKAEEVANNFKSSFQRLSTLVTGEVSKTDFLNQLYTHITRDIKVNSISLSSENELGMDGATGSYRQVADLMLGLKGFDKLSEISLKNVSVADEEGIPISQKIVFSITAKVDFKTGATGTGAAAGTGTTTP